MRMFQIKNLNLNTLPSIVTGENSTIPVYWMVNQSYSLISFKINNKNFILISTNLNSFAPVRQVELINSGLYWPVQSGLIPCSTSSFPQFSHKGTSTKKKLSGSNIQNFYGFMDCMTVMCFTMFFIFGKI